MIRILRELKILSISQDLRLSTVFEYIRHAERQIDEIRRIVVLDEKIPHQEKVSIRDTVGSKKFNF